MYIFIGIAKWSHIEAFYELDKNNPIHVYATKLTEKHLKPNLKQKMKVSLAAQIFSNTVSGGILAKISSGESSFRILNFSEILSTGIREILSTGLWLNIFF